MEALRRLRNDYDTDGSIRTKVLLAAAVLTIANFLTLAIPIMPFLTTVPIICLYYITDGIAFFIGLVVLITKAIVRIAGVFIPLLGFFAGFGVLISIIMIISAVPATVMVCLIFAWMFPIAFVPLFHFAANKLGMRREDLKAEASVN